MVRSGLLPTKSMDYNDEALKRIADKQAHIEKSKGDTAKLNTILAGRSFQEKAEDDGVEDMDDNSILPI